MMLAHINDLARFLDSLERSFHHRIRFAHESDHGTVSVICLITDMSRPSLKLGTHSMIFFIVYQKIKLFLF